MDLVLSRIDLIRETVKITHTWGGGGGVPGHFFDGFPSRYLYNW